MTITDDIKVDFLWKKIIFGVSQTNVENGGRGPGNESLVGAPLASPVATLDFDVYAEASSIPVPAPTLAPDTSSGVVIRREKQLVKNPEVGGARDGYSWLAVDNFGAGATNANRLKDWIPFTIDSSYSVRIFDGPNQTGTEFFSNVLNQEWVFDYKAGTLYFVNGNSSTNLYISGYQYIGAFGLNTTPGGGTVEYLAVNPNDPLPPDAGTNRGDLLYIADYDGNGNPAMLIWSGTAWEIVADEAVPGTFVESFDFSSPNPIPLRTIPAGRRITSIAINVTTPFTAGGVPAGSLIRVGDGTVGDRFLSESENDLNELGTYISTPADVDSADIAIQATFTNNGADAGEGEIVVTYV